MFSEQLCIQVIASLIEPILALFQVEIELLWLDAMKLMQPTLGITPETLYPIDMMCPTHELVRTVVDPEVFRIADIDQAVVAPPPVREVV